MWLFVITLPENVLKLEQQREALQSAGTANTQPRCLESTSVDVAGVSNGRESGWHRELVSSRAT